MQGPLRTGRNDIATHTVVILALIALLLGIGAGTALDRHLLSRGLRGQRRSLTRSIHYTLGFNYLVSNEIDQAIDELNKIVQSDPGAVEIFNILGNLYREKGQVERAIHIHKGVLQRPGLRDEERLLALYCLALDFRKSGLFDRAVKTFEEVVEENPNNIYAFRHLEKLYEEERNWDQAYKTAQRILRLSNDGDTKILAFLQNEMGEEALRNNDHSKAQKHFQNAIGLYRETIPAYLNLGETFYLQKKYKRAKAIWEDMISIDSKRVYLIYRRLGEIYQYLGEYDKLESTCRKQINENPDDWRARMILGEMEERHKNFEVALHSYMEALRLSPHNFSIHQRVWNLFAKMGADAKRIGHYLELCEDVITFADRYICLKCHYQTTSVIWRCPSCHEWNPFVEDLS